MEDENITDIESKSAEENDENSLGNNKCWFALWITFCICFSIWFLKKVVRGRQQLRSNFDAIEKELKRMQNIMDKHQGSDADSNSTEELPADVIREILETDKDK